MPIFKRRNIMKNPLTTVKPLFRYLATLLVLSSPTLEASNIESPKQVEAGSTFDITVSGEIENNSFLTVVSPSAEEGRYESYVYVNGPRTYQLAAPVELGEWELRLLGPRSPYPTVWRKRFSVTPSHAEIKAPTSVAAGARFEVHWTGPNNPQDYIAIGDVNENGRVYITYAYTQKGSPLTLKAPEKAGNYLLKYFIGKSNHLLTTRSIEVSAVSANIEVPSSVAAGALFDIHWQGPNNENDYVTIVPAGAADKTWTSYVYTRKGSPLKLPAPETPGDYEVRYLTGGQNSTLASAAITVGSVSASLNAPVQAQAGTLIEVRWQGPNNPQDYITIVPKGANEGSWKNYSYTSQGNPLKLRMPNIAGEYEIRYAMGRSYRTLASTPIQVNPAALKAGKLRVDLSETAKTASWGQRAVEVVLDASGSMLQRIDGKQRIAIARETLEQLVQQTIPQGTPFALRVFGQVVDACETQLVQSLSPTSAAEVAAALTKVEARDGAKTPIAESLARIPSDLAGADGEKLVILLTDGEETCNGDPEAVIADLIAQGINVRINIVGFAIDDAALENTFKRWAEVGGGAYYSAANANTLTTELEKSTRVGFELLDNTGSVIASGNVGENPIEVLPGQYNLRLKGLAEKPRPVQIEPEKETHIIW